ncbi:MAG TPA: cation diffusion facilitator family transporter [Caulobacteraceae bacterium]|jgi:cation diffusion facilitator family transporter|nr:cation diffusion facilitator family transporter [Caulobacteraceae bacterium]
MSIADRAQSANQVTLLSVAVAVTLVMLKIGVWWLSHSIALLASALDSGLDLIASLSTFFAVRYAAAPPDREHRFGHGKAEAFASLMQAGLVFASAAVITQQAIVHLLRPAAIERESWAIGVMLISILLTGGLIFAQTRHLKTSASVAVSADRIHYGADLASNIIALLAIAAAWAGLGLFDPIGGLGVAAILLWGAIRVFRESSDQLLDHELPDEDRRKIIELMTQDKTINHIHQLRTRASGPIVHIQLHADLDPDMTLDQAHRVVVAAERRVLEAFPDADILIHADPRGRAEPHGGPFGEVQIAQEKPV